MTCRTIVVDGMPAIVCVPRPRRQRCACGAPAKFLCDHKKPNGRTCDKPLCARCAIEIGEDLHNCRAHEPMARQGTLAL